MTNYEIGLPESAKKAIIKATADLLYKKLHSLFNNGYMTIGLENDSETTQLIAEKILETASDTVNEIEIYTCVEMENSLDNIDADIMDILVEEKVISQEESDLIWDALAEDLLNNITSVPMDSGDIPEPPDDGPPWEDDGQCWTTGSESQSAAEPPQDIPEEKIDTDKIWGFDGL